MKAPTVRIIISDHAVLRWLERAPGPHAMDAAGRIDVAAVKRAMMASGRETAFAAGAKGVRIGDVEIRAGSNGAPGVVIISTVVPAGENVQRGRRPHPSNAAVKAKDGRTRKRRERSA